MINPLHPEISLPLVHTVIYTFLRVLTGRVYLTINTFFNW